MSLAPAATRDGWSYSGELHVEASNNRHRRATLPELKAVFDGSDGAKDRPAHWYEAQLIHYGLPPSKTKGTAKMRLFDAVSQGNLAVPGHILKTEAELKKEWTKRDREAKQALKKSTATAAKTPRKRKADDGDAVVASGTNVNINISLSVGAQGHVQVVNAGPASKKAKTSTATKSTAAKATPSKATATKATAAKATAAKATVTKSTATKSTATKSTITKSTTTKTATAKATPAKATTAKATPAKATPAKATPAKATPAKPTPAKATPAKPTPATRKPQTARRGTSSAASSRPVPPPPSSERAPRTKQTARRSRPFNPASQGRTAPAAAPQPPRFDATPAQWDTPDDPPPPYPGSCYDDDEDDYENDGYDSDGHDPDGYDNSRNDNNQDTIDPSIGTLAPLGLLNGRYEVRCADYEEDWGIIFTLDGTALWGSFEIGPLSGILRLAERPWASSHRRLYFEWRGEDDEGERFVETDDGSYVVFLGNGVIVGELCFYGRMLEFEGCRVSGQETRSEVSVAEVRSQWETRW